MTDNEIIQEAKEAVEKGLPCAFLVKPLLDVVKEQKTEIAKKDTEIDILIRKKEALRDEVAEQQAEIERLTVQRNAFALGMKVAKSEAYREFAERLKQISKEITIPYIADTTIQEHRTGVGMYEIEDLDNLLKELISNDMGRYDPYTDSFVKEPAESNE